jgi:Ca-activated chloride channel family protein
MHSYFTWQDPSVLKALWLAPVLAWLVWRAVRKREFTLRAFLGKRFAPADWRWHWRRHFVKGALVIAALALLVLAVARPRVGSEVQKVKRLGADVVLVIDTSDSMLAQDVQPNRLEAAKEACLALIGRLEGDRIGVIVFAGSAYMYSPLTIDHDAASMFVQSIERGSAPSPGTALQGAMLSALKLLDNAEHNHRAIILFSDGEDHPGVQLTALKDARAHGVRVHVVGLGGTEGEPIPMPESEGDEGEEGMAGMLQQFFGGEMPSGVRAKFKRDKNGETVLTRMNAKMLADIARQGGGVFVKSSESGANIDQVYNAIAGMEGTVVGTYEFTQYAERFQWPLGFALLLLVLEGFISEAPRRQGGDRGER